MHMSHDDADDSTGAQFEREKRLSVATCDGRIPIGPHGFRSTADRCERRDCGLAEKERTDIEHGRPIVQ